MIETVGFQPREACRECARLLLRVHELIRQGEGDGEEADQVREALDGPSRDLTPVENELLWLLSGDLYMLAGEEIYTPAPDGMSDEAISLELKRCLDISDWIGELRLLSTGPAALTTGRVAYYRGRTYAEMGLPEVALAFYEHAVAQDPDDVYSFVPLLDLLVQLGLRSEAGGRAEAVLRAESESPAKRLKAAMVLFNLALLHDETRATQAARRLIPTLEALLSQSDLRTQWALLHAGGQVILGSAYQLAGDNGRAVELYRDILERDPNASLARLSLGVALYPTNPDAAAAAFAEVAKRGTSSVWPYFYLCHDHLVRGEYEQALRDGQSALQRVGARMDARAHLLEWTAIADVMCHGDSQRVGELFDEAIAIDPLNAEIRHNQQQAMADHGDAVDRRWRIDPPAARLAWVFADLPLAA